MFTAVDQLLVELSASLSTLRSLGVVGQSMLLKSVNSDWGNSAHVELIYNEHGRASNALRLCFGSS